ncbi:IclR family transcriptional regulator [Nocardioides sp. JQ2195]|uniref:IclR family transcriptional regulator n=1 Tax=Nocardioides sp. JQ2195 TaxID=2592334 RepID=UPI001F0E1D70|nr:IclR family transcriptional regulator [Nocardioides sp. JQ2195]
MHRALDLVEIVAAAGGRLSIGEVATGSGLPVPTVHRLLRTLVDRGYMRQLASRQYALGFRFVPLGTTTAALVGTDAEAVLTGLVRALGESANVAVLSGDRAEYVAQVPSAHSMRLFTEVGRQVELHSTGVGKAMLAQLDDSQIDGIVRRAGLAARTEHTITDRQSLQEAITWVRERGHAMDEQEQELGVRCVAVGVPGDLPTRMAVSISGPLTRMSDEVIARAVPLLHAGAVQLASEIGAAH